MPLVHMIAQGTLGLVVALPGYAIFYSWRARRRNRRELCGHCGGPQYAPGTLEGPSVVQGMLVCAPCAARLRRRYVLALSCVGALVAVVVTSGTLAAIGGSAPFGPLQALVIAAEYGGFFGGALWWMRRRNRQKLLELERTGEIPPGSSPLLRDH